MPETAHNIIMVPTVDINIAVAKGAVPSAAPTPTTIVQNPTINLMKPMEKSVMVILVLLF